MVRLKNTMLRLPPILRPRLTWKYVVCSGLFIYVLYCFLFSSPLLASNLPQYTGPYAVGTIDIETPVEHQRAISGFKLKDTGEPAFPLDTVLFSLYYPATNLHRSKTLHHWIPKPIWVTAEGYLRFGHVSNFVTNGVVTASLWSLAGSITIPAAVDVPLDQPLPALEVQAGSGVESATTADGFPILIFSHGFASSRTDYTHYLGELASRGYVVAAVEHRDGSGPGSVVMKKGLTDKVTFPIRLSDIDDHPELDTATFKQAQLDLREAEVYETLRVLRSINDGEGEAVFQRNPRGEGRDLKDWRGSLNVDEVTVGGHSFGATLALQALKSSNSLPFKGGIALDPGKSSGPLNAEIDVPLLIIHSNSWSATHSIFYGRPHFDVVKDLVQGIINRGTGAWFVTSIGTSHPSVTDAPLIEPLLLSWTTGATIDVKQGLRQYVHASHDLMRYQSSGKREGLLAQPVSHPEYKDPGAKGGKIELDKEFRQYWEVHVAP